MTRPVNVLVFRAAINDLAPAPDLPLDELAAFIERRWSEIGTWAKSLDIERAQAMAMFKTGDGRYMLHVNELAVDENGNPYVDWAANRPATAAPRVIDLGPHASWPAEFNGPHYTARAGAWF